MTVVRILHNHINMSRAKLQTRDNREFVARFIEACGTHEPAKIQRLLNISYQTAKNYLNGRLPNSNMLVSIATHTSCSIDWLLTGRGKKFLETQSVEDTPIPAGQMETFVRKICVEVVNEFSGRQESAQAKVVVLQSSELLSEKVTHKATARAGRQR